MKATKPKLGKASSDAIELFDERAQIWGWERDQGTSNVKEAEDEYKEAKAALIKRVLSLETQVRNLKQGAPRVVGFSNRNV